MAGLSPSERIHLGGHYNLFLRAARQIKDFRCYPSRGDANSFWHPAQKYMQKFQAPIFTKKEFKQINCKQSI